MRVDPEQPIASAWLSAVEQAAGLGLGVLVPVAAGGHYEWRAPSRDLVRCFLGFPIPRRRWA